MTFLSLFDLAGSFGQVVKSILIVGFGRGAFLSIVFFAINSIVLIRIQKNRELGDIFNARLVTGGIIMLLAFLGFLSLFFGITSPSDITQVGGGGLVGYLFYPVLLLRFGPVGAFVVLFFIFLFGFLLFSQKTVSELIDIAQNVIKNPSRLWDLIPDVFEIWKELKGSDHPADQIIDDIYSRQDEEKQALEEIKAAQAMDEHQNDDSDLAKSPSVSKNPLRLALSEVGGVIAEKLQPPGQASKSNQSVEVKTVPGFSNRESRWTLPPLQLLKENTDINVQKEDIEGNKQKISHTFHSFGIKVWMSDAITGPTVSQYTFRPDTGVKLSRIASMRQDLALALAASSLRMEMPIPGKNVASIEIPNRYKQSVRIRDLVASKQFKEYDQPLPIVIGKTVSGQNLIYSLAKAPHLLVAGATGAGKSVWINSLLVSLLYRYSPEDLQLILVDMKMVELNLYDGTPHLLTEVITEADKAINALKWSIFEMDRRYQLLKQYGKRNIRDYNQLAKTATEKLDTLPYIVFVIDELADLMMQAKSEVEPIIARLTAMSRAVGIHLVLGTQRPDVNIVTGLIKTNIPSRICFAVVSQIDSRVILDTVGGETLLGMGDGLIKSPNSIQPIRFQGANVDENEVKDVVQFVIKQNEAKNNKYSNFNPDVTAPPVGSVNVPGMKKGKLDPNDGIALYEAGKKLVVELQQCSVSILSGNLDIDNKTAKKIIDELQNNGVVGPEIPGVNYREVLMSNF